jgi:hypothetical protein
MFHRRALRLTVACLALASSGCSSLRELARSDYLDKPERRDVRVLTRDGLEYEFDYARVQGDSLVGYRSRNVEGSVEDFAVLPIAFEDIGHLSVRSLDWGRTLLVGGGVVVAGALIGLAASAAKDNGSTDTGGKVPIP